MGFTESGDTSMERTAEAYREKLRLKAEVEDMIRPEKVGTSQEKVSISPGNGTDEGFAPKYPELPESASTLPRFKHLSSSDLESIFGIKFV